MQDNFEKYAGEIEEGLTRDDWHPPMKFDTLKLPAFPTNCLPSPLREYVCALAESTQTPEEMAGILSLGVLATAFQSRYVLEVTSDWWEPLCLYLIAVAPPGERKSAVISALTRPIYQFEANRRETDAEAIARSQAEKRILEKAAQKAEEAAAKAGKEDFNTKYDEALRIAAELAAHKDVHETRLLADDTTPEKLVALMAEQGGTITICSAEGGIFDAMNGRYDRVLKLDPYLQAHSGDPILVDRIGRKRDRISSPRLTMILAAQPEVLINLMNNISLRGRGLCARFLYAMCHSIVGHRAVEPDPIPEDVQREYDRFVSEILSQNGKGVIRLSRRAMNVCREYQAEIERRLGDEWELMSDWGGKIVGAMLRIAALIHCAESYDDPATKQISEETVCAAISIAEYLSANAEAAYQQMGANGTEQEARYLLKRILSAGKSSISKREVFRLTKGHFKKAEEMDPALQMLVDMGYIQVSRLATGGRPSDMIMINPYAGKAE